MTYECIKEGTIGEKVDIETFVITECNRKQSVLDCVSVVSILIMGCL